MSFSRKWLSGNGIPEEFHDILIDKSQGTETPLRQQRDDALRQAEAIPELKHQLEEAKKQLEEAQKAAAADETGAKLKAVTDEFEAYKAEMAAKEAKATADKLFRALFKERSADPDFEELLMGRVDLSTHAVENGEFADKDAANATVEQLQKQFPKAFMTNTTEGAKVAHPPASGGGALTKEQFAKMTLRERNDLYVSDRETYDAMVAEG